MKFNITVIDDARESVFAHDARSTEPVTIRRRSAVDFEVVGEHGRWHLCTTTSDVPVIAFARVV